jgi:hypothetical protein
MGGEEEKKRKGTMAGLRAVVVHKRSLGFLFCGGGAEGKNARKASRIFGQD